MMSKTPLPPSEPDGPTPEQLADELAHACHLSPIDRLKMWRIQVHGTRWLLIYGLAHGNGMFIPGHYASATLNDN
jgi:hypothetical protein